MSRLIDADALAEKVDAQFETLYKSGDKIDDLKNNLEKPSFIYRHGIKKYIDACDNVEFLRNYLDGAPTVDAKPVRHGRWVRIGYDIYECSECGKNIMTRDIGAYDYCHGCGARMNEVGK